MSTKFVNLLNFLNQLGAANTSQKVHLANAQMYKYHLAACTYHPVQDSTMKKTRLQLTVCLP